MRMLSISSDATILDLVSDSAKRQLAYYEGYDADIVVWAKGQAREVSLSPSLRVYQAGGANRLLSIWRAWKIVRRLSKNKRFDLVTIQEPYFSALVATAAGNAPYQLQDHSAQFSHAPFRWYEKVLRFWAKRAARRAARVRTVSQRGKRGLMSMGAPEDRIDVIPVYADVSRFINLTPRPADHGRLLCVSRLSPEKGIDVLLRAFKIVRQDDDRMTLTIVGGGAEKGRLEALSHELSLEGAVKFVGQQSAVAPFLAEADIYVQPSYYEGWGRTVIEAAAAGLPIVMTDVGCAGEVVIDGESGLVVPVGQPEALVKAILKLKNDSTLARRLGAAARVKVSKLPDFAATVSAVRLSLEKTAQRKSSLLVLCQAVDLDDPLFAYFHSWLAEASAGFSLLTVLALRVGRYDLPANVTVLAMRPAGSKSRGSVLWTIFLESWRRRGDYQAVFSRGNAEYIALFGWLWRLMGKKVALFYAHYTSRTPWLRAAAIFANAVVTSVPAACDLKKAIPIGQGVDGRMFARPHEHIAALPRLLIYGRVSPVKRVPWMIERIAEASKELLTDTTVIGRATKDEEAANLRVTATAQGVEWQERDVKYADAPNLYRDFDIYLNATPGSLDKTIVEAMMSGLVVIASTAGFGEMLPADLAWLHPVDADFSAAVSRAGRLFFAERQDIGSRLRQLALAKHSQAQQIAGLERVFAVLG